MTAIDEFLKDTPDAQRQVLERVRLIIKQVVPEGEDTISYGIPVVKYKGKYVIGFAPFKNHLSIFPGALAIELTKDRLTGHKTAKGTIQFSVEKPISETLLKEIITICLKARD